MSAPADDPDALGIAAAEFVIGTLDPDERAAFSSRLRTDEVARAAVLSWEGRLDGLRAHGVEENPPADLWLRIERALPSAGATPRPFRVIDGGARSGAAQTQLKRSRDRWRAGALAAGGIAAALVAFLAVRESGLLPLGRSQPATYVAAVNRGGEKPALIVRVDFKTRRVMVRTVAAQAPPDRSLELWYIGDGGTPRSMGLVQDASATLPIPADAADDDAATFAVSVEPRGGSTTGAPTGQVVYSGQLVKE